MAYPTDPKQWYLAGPNSWGVRSVGECGLTDRQTPIGELTVCGQPVPVWGTTPECPLVPVSEWRPVERAWAVWEIVDQAQQNSCNGAAVRQAFQVLRELRGLRRVRFSHGNIYGRMNHGRDMGSALEDALKEICERGIIPCEAVEGFADYKTVDQYVWQTAKQPSGWEATAAEFKAVEAWEAPTLAHIVSGILKGAVASIGVDWPGGGGHAIMAVDVYPEKKTIPAGWWQFRIGEIRGMEGKYGGYLLRSPTIARCDAVNAPALA